MVTKRSQGQPMMHLLTLDHRRKNNKKDPNFKFPNYHSPKGRLLGITFGIHSCNFHWTCMGTLYVPLEGLIPRCMKWHGSQIMAETDNAFETLVTIASHDESYNLVSYDKEMISVNSYIAVLYNLMVKMLSCRHGSLAWLVDDSLVLCV